MNISQFQSINPRLRASYHQSSIKMDSTSTSDQLASINKIKDKMDLPDKVIENIQQMAREDAKKGIYKDDKYISYVNAYKEAHISPDRSKLMMMFQPMIMNARYTDGKPSFFPFKVFLVLQQNLQLVQYWEVIYLLQMQMVIKYFPTHHHRMAVGSLVLQEKKMHFFLKHQIFMMKYMMQSVQR